MSNTELTFSAISSLHSHRPNQPRFNLLNPIRQWLDGVEIHDRQLARLICKAIPAQCPFERDINLFGRKVAHIPPMCKLNPLYDQFVGLRFRALCYLVDECGETI
ncbi:nitrogenase [Phormidesmis priestleyi ULC007]|uniref:Nitrogenase n=1 Tax=Phormidesmis priestleyi ULC007 TaxID=1920490 RepID=A0A2T1DB58_9CYAN|nr:Mo-dependent nitrogenase C-terminal domain-containing protein [Phormidesmis priestleyi]PSB17719.1 nitrogenase [Phormidesmis priestleyi ULC007]PZO48660.1 MAG: nitrogenase [Phormidesmis priestleyi]